MLNSRQRHVVGLVSKVRKTHPAQARMVLARRSAQCQRSGDFESAGIWSEALAELIELEMKSDRLAQSGYLTENDSEADQDWSHAQGCWRPVSTRPIADDSPQGHPADNSRLARTDYAGESERCL